MECSQFKNLIPQYSDGELESEQRGKVKEHLALCEACQKECKAYERSWQMLKEWRDIQPAPGFVSRFWTKISLQETRQEKWARQLKDIFSKKKLAPAAMTTCLLIMMGLFVFSNYTNSPTGNKILAVLYDQDDLEMIENMDLAENYDVIEDLDFFEDMDTIEQFDSVAGELFSFAKEIILVSFASEELFCSREYSCEVLLC